MIIALPAVELSKKFVEPNPLFSINTLPAVELFVKRIWSGAEASHKVLVDPRIIRDAHAADGEREVG